jgi:hypothetical protein
MLLSPREIMIGIIILLLDIGIIALIVAIICLIVKSVFN